MEKSNLIITILLLLLQFVLDQQDSSSETASNSSKPTVSTTKKKRKSKTERLTIDEFDSFLESNEIEIVAPEPKQTRVRHHRQWLSSINDFIPTPSDTSSSPTTEGLQDFPDDKIPIEKLNGRTQAQVVELLSEAARTFQERVGKLESTREFIPYTFELPKLYKPGEAFLTLSNHWASDIPRFTKAFGLNHPSGVYKDDGELWSVIWNLIRVTVGDEFFDKCLKTNAMLVRKIRRD
jgi:hypothetical protein